MTTPSPSVRRWSRPSRRGEHAYTGELESEQELICANRRINPEMSNQIADGLHHMDLNVSEPPHLSPFPKLQNPPPNVPPSDDELEARLENARSPVLNSNDPEMQLAWAQDALTYCGSCSDEAERLAALKPQQARSTTPRVEHQLKQDAMSIVTFLADQHHPRAEFLRGLWLEYGRHGQREDKKEAFRCYSRAADRGYSRAEYRIGMLYESYNDPIKALRHYHRGVDAGDAASCYRLGMMTLRGQHGQEQDFAKAIALIKQSAEGADENAAQGAYVYGMLLARQLPQIEVPEIYLEYNEGLAKQNLEKAAYMKFAKAQAKMGSCYELGSLGCEFSPALSVHYNALASKQGEADADMALSKWFLVGSEGLFPKNEELAFTYAERAAASGLPTAEFALGYFHEIGMYVPVNIEKAQEWYQKAAKHGNTDATARIESLAKKQVLNKRDHEQVAINRIKSQHGSMRGQRPERFRQQQQPSLGTVEEPPSYPPYSNGGNAVQAPSRNSSRTPYPENDGPPVVTVPQRPASAAPYPLEDGPPPQQRLGAGPGPTGGFFAGQPPPQPQQRPATTVYPDMRPSSAFQINPELRSSSTASVPNVRQSGPGGYPGGLAPHPPPGPGGYRPQTAQPYDQRQSSAPAPAYGFDGRPLHPNDPRARPIMGGRTASGPPAPMQGQRIASGGPPPPGPGNPPHAATDRPAPLQPAKVDIGFAAPPDQRAPTVDPTYQEKKPRRRRGSELHDSMPEWNPALQQKPMGSPALGSRPDSRVPDNRKPSAPQQAPQKPEKAKPTAAKPPGKGPKTFDEMGVPAHQQDKECVMM